MNKNFIKLALAFVAGATLLVACDKDEPVKPSNEIHHKLHEMPFGAKYTLTEVELSSPEVFDQAPRLSTLKEEAQSVQTIRYASIPEKGWLIPEDSPNKVFQVKTTKDNPNTAYILSIEYYNAEGKPMNEQFIDNGQDKIHQHFFLYYKKAGALVTKDPSKLPYDYRYADTTPWNSTMGAHTGDVNPIGFEGLIRFVDKGVTKFDINADLVHAFKSKYETDGSTNPFYDLRARLDGESDRDISVKLPFQIGDEVVDPNTGGEEPGDNPNNGGEQPGDNPNNGGEQPGDNPNTNEEEKLEAGEFGKLNKTKAVKMVIKMYEGHLHEPANFHYVAGPVIPSPNLRMDQEIVLLWQNGAWRSAENTTYTTIVERDEDDELTIKKDPSKKTKLDRLFFKGAKFFKGLPFPAYGCWIEYYDAEGKIINGDFVSPGAYQHFFQLKQMEGFGTLPLEASQLETDKVLEYHYKDSTPWNRSVAKEGAKYTAEPLGLKGYFVYKTAGFKGALNIELHDKAADASAAPFHSPKATKPIVRVSIPIYVPYMSAKLETFAQYDGDSSWDDLSEEQKAMADVLKVAFNTAKPEDVLLDLIFLYNGDRGKEASGVWF